MSSRGVKKAVGAALCAATVFCAPIPTRADYRDDIGIKNLQNKGWILYYGSSISVGQVEAAESTSNPFFIPDTRSGEFSHKSFHTLGGGSSTPSSHATMVGILFYGNDHGIAPKASNITLVSADKFLTTTGLKTGSNSLPTNLGTDVINNSWVSTGFTRDSDSIDAVRRLDYMIERDNVLVVNATQNGSGTTIPKLLASSFNGLTVGIPYKSSNRPLAFDGGVRKPDLVVSAGTTSEAAAIASGAATLLWSEGKGRHLPVDELAIKTIMMAGAQRPGGWQRGAAGGGDDKSVPLDYGLGAGLLRVDNSFEILTAGRRRGTVPATAWDSNKTPSGKNKTTYYTFNVPQGADEFSAYLDWNRDITTRKKGSSLTLKPSLSDLDLCLYRLGNNNNWSLVSKSESATDNVESITMNSLDAGLYRLSIKGDAKVNYALAWRSELKALGNSGGGGGGGGGGDQGDDDDHGNGGGSGHGNGNGNGKGKGKGKHAAMAEPMNVPEPTSLVMVALSGCALLRRRCR